MDKALDGRLYTSAATRFATLQTPLQIDETEGSLNEAGKQPHDRDAAAATLTKSASG
jgi:hypothetical protein